MKKILLITAMLLSGIIALAQPQEDSWYRVEASELNLIGKAFDTPNPYHRVDTLRYDLVEKRIKEEARDAAGLAVLFRTDATEIGVSVEFGPYKSKQSYRSYRGVDLYIMKDGRWKWAGMTDFYADHSDPQAVKKVVWDMDSSVKDCIMYLPIESEIYSLKVCVPRGSKLEALESPFRHKVVFHGSSFTHGISTERAGMSYPMQFMCRTGLQVIPMGFSGRCKMQPYMAEMMADVEADAYVFDAFSNPDGATIKKRLFPFIERMISAHPGKPLIFQRTIYWERSNFNLKERALNEEKWAVADSLMKIACKKYPDVYYIKTDASSGSEESSTADGIHPTGFGYGQWERSIEKPILKILRKYKIK